MNIKRPNDLHGSFNKKSVFLAGTTASDISGGWQSRMEQALGDLDITVLNPKIDSWFRQSEQTIQNSAFNSQVNWELEGLECADVVVLCLLEASQSPITLIEFGLTAKSGRLVVYCEKDFWRYGNVEVVCHRYGVPMAHSIEKLIDLTKDRLMRNDEKITNNSK